MLSPEAPVRGAARPAVNVTAADFQAMMARRTGSGSTSAKSKSKSTPKSKSSSKSKSASKSSDTESAAVDVMDAEDTTEEERKILEAEDLVRELDALLAEKESLEKEVKTKRREIVAQIGGSEALAALEAGAASDAANEERILSARSKPVFFTETGHEEEWEETTIPTDEPSSAASDTAGSDGTVVKASLGGRKGSVGSSSTAAGDAGKVDFLQRNVALAADGAAGALAMTAEERARIATLLGDDGEEGGQGVTDDGEENPFVIPGEESGAGYSYEADAETRLEEINVRLASFAGLMSLMAAHAHSDDQSTNVTVTDTTATTTTITPTLPLPPTPSSFSSSSTTSIPTIQQPAGISTTSASSSPAKTDSGQAEIAKQERLAQIDNELAQIGIELEALPDEPVSLDRAVLQHLLDSAQEEQRLAGVGSVAGAQATEGPAPLPQLQPEEAAADEDGEGSDAEGAAISAAVAAGLPTTAPGKKAVFF